MNIFGTRSNWIWTLALGALLAPCASAEEVFRDSSKPLDMRVNDLLARLTLEEKVSLIHGASKFSNAGIARLGIPPLWMSDGPHGVREEIGPDTWNPAGRTDDFSTAMPVGIGLAATWDPELASLDGMTVGQEALVRGKNIMLGPGVNIMRTPLNGRNFEYLGEDPYLASLMAVGYIQGEQSQGVAACVKHFAGNNQETQRNSINVEMDERTLHEIYLPAFKAAVKDASVWSVMGAYNRFRGTYCCENPLLLNAILKNDWKFQGLVMSDWGGAHSTAGSAQSGLDLEMGTNGPYEKNYLGNAFLEGIQKGVYSQSLLDDKVVRVLRVLIATHGLDKKPVGSINTRQHQNAARNIAEDGIVLLKNDGAKLPLDITSITSVAVIGSVANQKVAAGGQSSGIKAFYEITALEGLIRRLGDKANVNYSPGYVMARRSRRAPTAIAPTSEISKRLADQAVTAAKASDVAIVFVGLNHDYDTEGSDRTDMKLPAGQEDLIERVMMANPRTIVVLESGSPVEMGPWVKRVPSLIEAWYGGSEGGNAIAHVLFGDVNPSGKLPCTFPKRLEDTPTYSFKSYPGENGLERYTEGLLVGYRWYDNRNIEPLFPFGFGLSYTKFEYSQPIFSETPKGLSLSFSLTNSGARDGAEVTQLYVRPLKPSVMRPIKELKGFHKVFLRSGEKQNVIFDLPRSAFAYYDPAKKAWVAEQGSYEVLVGSSSRDLQLKQTVMLPVTTEEKD